MNPVLDRLCSDHANFAKLLNVIEQQAARVRAAGEPDYEALDKAVEYLEGYPSLFHHPLENILCERIKQVAPEDGAKIDSIMSEHAGIRSELACFKELVNNAEKGSIVARSSFSDAAITFVESEWRHMELERTRLFPVALALLSVDDWDYIEGLAPSVEDTLFGDALSAPMRRLHELLSECDSIETTARLLGATSLP